MAAVNPGLTEAQVAHLEATRKLRTDIEKRGPLAELTARLRRMREENHFAESVRRALGGPE